MRDPCNVIRKSSSYIRRWLTRQPGVREESLTDWLLYNVSKCLPFVQYVAFSHHQEARETGADWEWWILFQDNYFRLRVQAKKVSAANDNYPELARTNRYGLQIEKLLEDAGTANAIPLYALYSAETGHSICECRSLHGDEDGVFLAGASRLHDDFIAGRSRQRISSSDLLTRSNPFSCFACSPRIRWAGGTMYHFLHFFEHYYASEIRPKGENRDLPRGVHTELPEYVSSLVEHANEGIPDGWERKFRGSLQDFNAILVYDHRIQTG